MVYRGTFKNGVVVFDGQVDLPEGQRVFVDPMQSAADPQGPISGDEPTVWQELLKLSGTLHSGRRDGSVNHDHYISGAPKREHEE